MVLGLVALGLAALGLVVLGLSLTLHRLGDLLLLLSGKRVCDPRVRDSMVRDPRICDFGL